MHYVDVALESVKLGDRLVGAQATWRIDAELARGGTAVLFSVISDAGAVGVCKCPSGHRFPISKTMRERHQRELSLLSQIDHPNVLKVLDIVEIDGERASIFERAQQSIYQLLPKESRLKTADSLRWLADAANGLATLQAHEIVHRDIAPKNLLVMADGRVCVADLGAARRVGDDSITLLGEHLGSLIYVSDRQARNPHLADFSDDVFSLGQVAYHLLTGRRPIGNPPPLTTERSDLPAEFVDAVNRMRHPDPRRRPRDGQNLRQLLALNVGRTKQAALGLTEERLFDEAIDVVQRLIYINNKQPSTAEAAELIWSDQFLSGDTPRNLRFSRWRHGTCPDSHSKYWLELTEKLWRTNVVRDRQDIVEVPAHQTLASMDAVKEDLDFIVASSHRTALWMQMPAEPDETLHARGLSNLGRPVFRSALIVGEALLTLAARKRLCWDVNPLLPSSWLAGFDNIDETLLSLALDASELEDQAWDDAMAGFQDGQRLQLLWQQLMSTACRCRLIGTRQTESGEIPLSDSSDDCPFLRLEAVIGDLYDARNWVREWNDHPDLANVRFFANAALAARAQLDA